MSLKDRLAGGSRVKGPSPEVPAGPNTLAPALSRELTSLKIRLHEAVIDKLHLSAAAGADPETLRESVRQGVERVVASHPESAPLSPEEQTILVEAVIDEIVGLGPLEKLLADPEVSDILVNGPSSVYVERNGRLKKEDVRFSDPRHLLNTIQRIVSRVGRRVDESSPMVDARLPDGSRVNAIIPPVSPDGAVLSIRRFGARRLNAEDLVRLGVASRAMVQYLNAAVISKCNLIVSGGTGAGKTTLLNVASSFIPPGERIITVEDSAELSLQGHVVRLESRPANIEGRGEISMRALVRNALRMRPDRIVVGEIRGAEVLDMLQAMNTGHEGSMTTVHANSPSDAVGRLMMMLALSGITLSGESMAQFIGRSIRVIVQVARFPDGRRRITHIAEVTGFRGEEVDVADVFSYPAQTEIAGRPPRFVCSGESTLLARFAKAGTPIELGRGDA